MYLNRVTLIGFLGGNAEKKVSNATNIAVFSLATKTSWKNDAGTWESRTDWHRCVAFGRLAEFVATLAKGSHVAVEGELRSHEYQRRQEFGTEEWKSLLIRSIGMEPEHLTPRTRDMMLLRMVPFGLPERRIVVSIWSPFFRSRELGFGPTKKWQGSFQFLS